MLTGGGSQLSNLDVLLREETGLPVMVSDSPECAVVLGTGRALDELDLLQGSRSPVAGGSEVVSAGAKALGGAAATMSSRWRSSSCAPAPAIPGELSALDRGILRLVSPGQAAMSFVARAITGVAGRYVELTGVRAENEALHRENRSCGPN